MSSKSTRLSPFDIDQPALPIDRAKCFWSYSSSSAPFDRPDLCGALIDRRPHHKKNAAAIAVQRTREVVCDLATSKTFAALSRRIADRRR
jgi:hypothetical protein